VAAGFLVAEDVTEWVLGNHCYGISLEVVAELLGCDQDGIEQFLDLRIASLRLIQDLANEVDRVLDFVGVYSLFMLDNNGCVDHLVGRRDVD
jgi:hypothetical protein